MGESLERVAIIGMSGAFPGADNIDELWRLVCEGREGISTLTDEELLASGELPDVFHQSTYVRRGGFLSEAERFDHEFFRMSPADALNMDPQHRRFLTHARLALEDAGLPPERLTVPVGVFGAAGPPLYWFLLQEGPYNRSLQDFARMLGNDKDYLATRTSYKLNLTGPSMTVQTACSSSLVAVSLACQSLLTWGCDVALAGGVSLAAPRKRGYLAQDGMINSPTGVCRPFDADGDGTLFSEGVGVVCLKRLSEAVADGDFIYAVIDAIATNNDGADKVGFTAPSVNGQTQVIELAQALADVSADEVGYVETHGTATRLGDPIEIQALTQSFRKSTNRNGYCHLGSLKANIGHLDAAAGIASLIKTALVVQTGLIPGLRNFRDPNPLLDLVTSPFCVNQNLVSWNPPSGRRIAGLSSFGIGGTNVHAILESPPPVAETLPTSAPHPVPGLRLTMTAHSAEALKASATQVAHYLESHPDVSVQALARHLEKSTPDYPWRAGFASETRQNLVAELLRFQPRSMPSGRHEVVMGFPGQGSQFVAMARSYYGRYPSLTSAIDRALLVADQLGLGALRRHLFDQGTEQEIGETAYTQPLLYVVEYALAQELLDRGLKPSLLVGHSIGEYVAATVGGALEFSDGLRLVAKRGEVMQKAAPGAMVAVKATRSMVEPFLADDVFLSLSNGPDQLVLSGEQGRIAALEAQFLEAGLVFTRLRTSHAFHSPLMDSVLPEFEAELRKIKFGPLSIPIVSNVDGRIIVGEVDWQDYWPRHLRQTVQFSEGMSEIRRRTASGIFVEAGPGKTLSNLLRPVVGEGWSFIPSMLNDSTPPAGLHSALAKLWEVSVDVGLPPQGATSTLLLYPGYPLGGKNFWPQVSPLAHSSETNRTPAKTEPVLPGASVPNTLEEKLVAVWRSVLHQQVISPDDDFFALGGHSLSAIQLITDIESSTGHKLNLATVVRCRTPREIAKAIQVSATMESDHTILPLQPQGQQPGLYCICGLHLYQELASLFSPEVPVYGVFVPFEEELLKLSLGQSTRTVEDLAAEYVAVIRKHQPQGPYLLCGVSFGGALAYEIGHQFEASGSTVGLVAMFDSTLPSAVELSLRTRIHRAVSSFGHRVLERLGRRIVQPPEVALEARRQRYFEQAIGAYRVPESRNPVILVRAEELSFRRSEIKDPTYGWGGRAKNLTIFDNPGDHLGILAGAQVRRLADQLRNRVLEARNK